MRIRGIYDVIIIGSGIAGSSLAFELEKRDVRYLICTEQDTPLLNTSSLSYGHCRIPKGRDLDEIILRSVSHLGEDEERMRFVYSRAELVLNLFKELSIEFDYRSFGIIPSCKIRGGAMILRKIQQHIPKFKTGTELIGFKKIEDIFEVDLRKDERYLKLRSKYLVLATGGYGGKFEHTDNFRYNTYNVFDMVRQHGGRIINLDCVFIHPFGYNKGRRILIGNESKEGEFMDSEGNQVFDEATRRLIKNNDYHESFNKLIEQIESCQIRGLNVYFVDSKRRVEISPTAHYTAGGIETDCIGAVKGCKNLFAIGECRADGSKNGGRFPGYPFTSAVVYGKVLGERFS